ncbi:MAG TPA: PfkB family carbohydrate kinase [Candidatus Sulfotelmatobacter sp.]|jgi:rfaE bifunctional protein kinase chain/domain|nr:PfkB family carbohydrate kinase [Candidatus Sulfotelmatobacter sp.]
MNRLKAQASAEQTADLARLAEIVEQFRGKRVVLYGDFVADEFQYGDISRVSREAPVLILKHKETRLVPGGGANATNNLAALGANVMPVTVVGKDAAGEALAEYFDGLHVDTSGMVQLANWTTPTKTRFLAGWAHTTAQQVLRVDREPRESLPERVHTQLANKLFSKLCKADALAISDYGFGAATPESVLLATKKLRKKIPITLDARHGLTRYAVSAVVSATPNEAELEALHHTAIGKNVAELERCGRATLAAMKMNSLLVTRGRDGMALFEKEAKRFTQIPMHGSDQAVDVTGAGDTVLAAYTLALASGASSLEAAHIANIAGGLVVMKRGTATVSQAELLETIRREISGS